MTETQPLSFYSRTGTINYIIMKAYNVGAPAYVSVLRLCLISLNKPMFLNNKAHAVGPTVGVLGVIPATGTKGPSVRLYHACSHSE